MERTEAIMDRQLLIDKILETENLTDALEDDDANTLLDWGIAQVDALIKGDTDEEIAGDKINSLMHLMRGLNQIAGDPSRTSHASIVDLTDRLAKISGVAAGIEETEQKAVAERISKMQSGEALQHLIHWLQSKKS